MLSDEDKRRIETEERAKLERAQELEAEEARLNALESYRTAVKHALVHSPRPSSRVWWFVGAAVLVAGIAAYVLLPSASNPGFDDFSGGIATRDLIERCTQDVLARLGSGYDFPTPEERRTQITSDADGKRWDGWAAPNIGDANERTQFSCQYTSATRDLRTEIIQR
jgi:hypothetical protein